MFRIFFLLISLFFVLACSNCKDKNCPDFLFYQVPYTLTPAKDTFNLGDTLWVEMDFPEEMTDVNGGIKNIFHNYDFRLELAADKIDINPVMSKTIDYLRFHKVVGQDSVVNLPGAGVSGYKIFPIFEEGRYRFKCGLVTQKKGLFVLGIVPVSMNGEDDQFHIKGQCEHVGLSITSKLIGADGNFYLLQHTSEPAYLNLSKKRFEDTGGYCFVVK